MHFGGTTGPHDLFEVLQRKVYFLWGGLKGYIKIVIIKIRAILVHHVEHHLIVSDFLDGVKGRP